MNSSLRSNTSPAPSSCAQCAFLPECGGWDDERREEGCFQHCAGCFTSPCDHACPLNTVLFDRAFEETGGICVPPARLSHPPAGRHIWPVYFPEIYHGSGRTHVLRERWVAVPLEYVCTVGKSGIDLKYETRTELCHRLKLHASTNIVLTSVAPDHVIEGFWAHYRKKKLLERMAQWGLAGMTTPNFSFVIDGPRTNSLCNLSKIFRMIESIGDAGIPVIPHFQATTKSDWAKWKSICQSFPSARHFAMEFQTGLGNSEDGRARRKLYLENFRELQEECGGRIHPIVLAGGGREKMSALATLCQSYSVIDSIPFLKTQNRQMLVPAGARKKWRLVTTEAGEDLSQRLAQNIADYRALLLEVNGFGSDGHPAQPLLLPAPYGRQKLVS